MDIHTIAMLFGAGVIGGSLSGLVGGASLVTFPALLAAGLPPVTATASNVCCDDVRQHRSPRCRTARSCRRSIARFVGLIAASIVGAVIGASLLLLTPQRVFEILMPLLLGFATVLFALRRRISAWLARAGAGARHGRAPRIERQPAFR